MGTFRACFRRCAAWTAPAALAGAGLVAAGHAASGTVDPWLHVAAFLPMAASCLCAVSLWPLFAADANGRELVRRATKGPLHGMPTAAFAALAAAALGLLAIAAAAATLVPAPRAHHPLVATGRPILDDANASISFANGRECDELLLRPAALLPQGAPLPTRVEIFVDGERATPEPIAFYGHRQLAIVPLGGRRAERIEARRVDGNVPLLFDREATVVVEHGEASALAGCALALSLCLLPAFVALCIAMLTGSFVSTPVQWVATLAAVVVQTAGRAGPADAALTLCARGRWIPVEGLHGSVATSLAVGAAAMVVTALLQRGGSK